MAATLMPLVFATTILPIPQYRPVAVLDALLLHNEPVNHKSDHFSVCNISLDGSLKNGERVAQGLKVQGMKK